jgi:uncharacterized membrane protein
MTTDVPIQIIVAAFGTEDAAGAALKRLQQAQHERLIHIDDAAVLRKDADGKLHLHETGDLSGAKGAAIGGVTGAVVGLLAGPVGWAAGLGALIGGLGAKLRDSGFPDDRLRRIGEGLTPGSSAVVAVVEHTWVDTVVRELQQEGADIATERIQRDIADQLNAYRDVAYSALNLAGVTGIERDTTGDTGASAGQMIATPEGVGAARAEMNTDTVVGGTGAESPPQTAATSDTEASHPSGG